MKSVTVEAPARLHLGFIDLSGSLSRRYGSLGVAISGISTRLRVLPETDSAPRKDTPEANRIARYRDLILAGLNLDTKPVIALDDCIPGHAGLGSGTQLALAVGRGIAEAYEIDISTAEIATMMKRGARSGIGISVFDLGGFVVDLGRGAATVLPPELCRLDFPSQWTIVLITDAQHRGISGADETNAFLNMAPMEQSTAAALSHHTMMGVIPSVIEQDFPSFVRSLEFIQRGIGEYFAPYQGGEPFTSKSVAQLIAKIKGRYPDVGIGQSSWGPSGFVFCPNMVMAEEIASTCAAEFLPATKTPGLRVSIHRPRNYGAVIGPADAE